MTVAELIEELNKLPPDMLVMVPGYEGGYDNVRYHALINPKVLPYLRFLSDPCL